MLEVLVPLSEAGLGSGGYIVIVSPSTRTY
jgi:hypothetical protein